MSNAETATSSLVSADTALKDELKAEQEERLGVENPAPEVDMKDLALLLSRRRVASAASDLSQESTASEMPTRKLTDG